MRARMAVSFALLVLFALAAPGAAHAGLAAADLDGDGAITLDDLKRMAQELNTLAAAYRGDANGDGVVDAADLRHVARALVRAVAPDAPVGDDELDRFVRFAATGAPPEDAPAGADPREAEKFRELIQKLSVNPGSRTIASLEPPETPGDPGTPGQGPDGAPDGTPDGTPDDPGGTGSDPGGPGDDELGDRTLLPPPRGERPAFPPALRRFAAIFHETLKDADINFNIKEINEARTAILPDGFATAAIGDLFAAFEECPVDELPLSDCPDPTAFRSGETGPGLDRLSVVDSRGTGDGRRELLPRGRVALRFSPDDPESMRLSARGQGGAATLADEYEAVAPPAQGALPVTDAVPERIRRFSDDPWIAMIMTGLADAREFMGAVDRPGDTRPLRVKTLARFFSPAVAAAIAAGDPARVGLAPGSAIVMNYARAVEALTPSLIQGGVVNRETARAVRNTVASLPGGSGSISGTLRDAATGSDAAEAVPGYVHVNSRLHVRSGPSTNNAIVGRLPDGARVMILKRVGDWYKIRFTPYEEQGYAYVHSDYVSTALGGGGGSSSPSGGGTASGGSPSVASGGDPAPESAATKSLAGLSAKVGGSIGKAVGSVGDKIAAKPATGGLLGSVKSVIAKVGSTATKAVTAVKKWLF